MGMSLLEASRGGPKCCEARFAGSVEGMEGLFSDCRRASESIAELRSVRERLRKIEARVLSGWQELWRRITAQRGRELSPRNLHRCDHLPPFLLPGPLQRESPITTISKHCKTWNSPLSATNPPTDLMCSLSLFGKDSSPISIQRSPSSECW